MASKLLFIILTLLIITSAGLYYVNEFFLPVKLKDIFVEKISQELNREVSIRSLQYIPFKGLIAEDIIIAEKKPKKEAFITIKKASLGIFSFVSLAQGKIVIPSIIIQNPSVRLTKTRTKEWNFEDLLNFKKNLRPQSSFSIYVASFVISKGTIVFSDKTLAREPISIVENISLQSSLSLPRRIGLTLRVRPTPQNPFKIFANFNYDLATQEFISNINIENFSLTKICPYLDKPVCRLTNGLVKVATFDITGRQKKITAKGTAVFGNTKLKIQDDKKLFITPSLTLENLTLQGKNFHAKGTLECPFVSFNIGEEKKFKGGVNYNFILTKHGTDIYSNGNITITNAIGDIKPKIQFTASEAKGTASFSFDKNKIFNATGDLQLTQAKLVTNPGQEIIANPRLTISHIFNPTLEKDRASFEGTFSFVSGQALGLPLAGKIENIAGNFSFKKDEISWSNLRGLIEQMTIEASGSLKNFQNPSFIIEGSCPNLDLEKLQRILSRVYGDKEFTLKGSAQAYLKYQGSLGSSNKSSVELSANLTNASLKTKNFLKGITDASGYLDYKVQKFSPKHFLPDIGTWKNLRFIFNGKEYTSVGTLKFNAIDAAVLSENLNIKTTAKIFFDRIHVGSFNGTYLDSFVSAEGDIFYPEKTHGLPLDLALSGKIRLEHLTSLFPLLDKEWKTFSPQGMCSFKGGFKGRLDPNQWRNWTIFGKINSPEVSLKGYHIKNASLNFRQRDHMIEECILNADAYSGPVKINAEANLSEEKIPYHLSLDAKDVDLSRLKKDTPLKNKPLTGFASLVYEGNGVLADVNQTIGQGFLSVRNGEFMHIELVKGLGQLLFIPEHQNISFDHATSDFVVKNGKIFVRDGVLKGNEMQLTCNGTIDFYGNLDLDLISKFDRDSIRKSKATFQKSIASIITQADALLTVKLTGTLKEPKYYVVPDPLGAIQRATDLILESLPSIF
ncbi:MAG: AsmA-like C-terminal region-containing protein [Candidatus Aceula meridiana]|nr:AsmA-like C-terminal region-containing protein [Candidatus Aceula meridiana]